MFSSATIFQNLSGSWRLARKISSPEGMASGTATFTPSNTIPSTMHYHEEGNLHVATQDKALEFKRDYLYVFENDNINVYYYENAQRGNLLHVLNFNNLNTAAASAATNSSCMSTAIGVHHCGNDTYRATYQFINNNKFKLHYIVNGPHKDYTIETEFEKIESVAPRP
jgi:hypothetical protein